MNFIAKLPSRISSKKAFTNLEILQEYGELIKVSSEGRSDRHNADDQYRGKIWLPKSIWLIEWFIENNSEVLDHQDINETMIQPSNPLPLVENPRTRQFMTFKLKKSKLNDTNFETLGCSRDNISPLDHRLKSGKNYHTCKGDYMQSDEEAKSA